MSLVSSWSMQKHLPAVRHQLREEKEADGALAIVGEYQMVSKLGEGQFADVYECCRLSAAGSAQWDGPRYACKAILKARVERHRNLIKSKRNITRVDSEVEAMMSFAAH